MDTHPALALLMTEVHANIEINAEKAVQIIQMGQPNISYPPNGGLSKKEAKALATMDVEDQASAMALKKIIADAIYNTVYKLMTDTDGISSPDAAGGHLEIIQWFHGKEKKPMNEHPILNIALGDGYWKWVDVRTLKSPRLDNLA